MQIHIKKTTKYNKTSKVIWHLNSNSQEIQLKKKYATGNTIIYYHEGTCNIAAAVENIYYYVSSHAKSSRWGNTRKCTVPAFWYQLLKKTYLNQVLKDRLTIFYFILCQ